MSAHDTAGAAPNLPEVDADACVLGAAVHASCRACVDACPRGAWIMTDDGLGLATAACDGCGLCLPACPQGALQLPRPPEPARSLDAPATLLAACEIAVTTPGKGVMPCLHAFGLDELAVQHRRGIRHMLVARGDCTACVRGAGRMFDGAIEHLARLTADRGLEPLRVTEEMPAAWRALRDEHLRPSRRSLFNAFRQPAATPPAADAPNRPAALALPAGRPKQGLHPVLPVIDDALCEACDACARICPQAAIAIEPRGEGQAAYVVDAHRCTGCRLCVDLCDAGAVTLAAWTTDQPRDVDLDAAQCTACGNVFRVAGGRPSAPPLCRICTRTRHSRNLFQVMK